MLDLNTRHTYSRRQTRELSPPNNTGKPGHREILRLFALFFFLCFATIATAQQLPGGKLQETRQRTIDMLHLKVYINIDFTTKSIQASAHIRFKPLAKLTTFCLDAFRLDVKSVNLLRPGKPIPLDFEIRDDALAIKPDRALSADETQTVSIQYEAHPNSGLHFFKDRLKPNQWFCVSDGEMGEHPNWLPLYNSENDLFSSEIIASVPKPYSVISNGKLMRVTDISGNRRKFHWKQSLPHTQYLIGLYAGEFEKGVLPPAFGTVPLNYWTPKGTGTQAARAFRETTKMVEFYSNKLGYKYPWEKYDQVVLWDFMPVAMENTSASAFKSVVLRDHRAPPETHPQFKNYYKAWTAETLIAHELVHHWFGNLVTCRSMNHIWLHEGFASYLQMIWDEEVYGKDVFYMDRLWALDVYKKYVKRTNRIRPLEYNRYDTILDMFTSAITYVKGALVVHMMRAFMGDDGFYRTLAHFLHKHEFSNVTGHDLLVAIEEVTGKNFQWFFDDWIHGGGYPQLKVTSRYLKENKILELTVKQVQPIIEGQGLFTLPLEVAVTGAEGKRTETFWIKKHSESFTLPCAEAPHMISIDPGGSLVAEVEFNKPMEQLARQAARDGLPGRIRALRQMAKRYPQHPQTLKTYWTILSSAGFWGLKAEAALLLGKLRTSSAEVALLLALKDSDFRVRKAAILALPGFRTAFAQKYLKRIINSEKKPDLVATAIVALARTDVAGNLEFIKKQINRDSWYDEITLACLKAFDAAGEPSLVRMIKPYASLQRQEELWDAAYEAWMSCAPQDPELHKSLINHLKECPNFFQDFFIEKLGRLAVKEALPLLENLARNSGSLVTRTEAEAAVDAIKEYMADQ